MAVGPACFALARALRRQGPFTGRDQPGCRAGGRFVLPCLALHYPLFRWVNGVYQTVTHQRNALIEGAIIFVVVIVASYLALKFIDEPVRKFLSQRFLSSRA
jgi:peptidoglycan/LPS O-acetylase OafA/YrhL